MQQEMWTEAQLLHYIQKHSDHDKHAITARKLKRFRDEGVLPTPHIHHPGFGGTTSLYPVESGERVLAICRLLKQQRNFDAVRVGLWLEGYSIEIGLLKESLWHLIPFSSLQTPSDKGERMKAARQLTQTIGNAVWKSVRSNLMRKILEQFEHPGERQHFTSVLTQLLYEVPVDFTPTLLGYHDADLAGEMEEPADLFASGVQMQQLRFLPQDPVPDLQRLCEEKILSFTWQRTVLFAATEEELGLARSRKEIVEQMFEALDLIGQLTPLHSFLFLHFSKRQMMQALLLVLLLVLEQAQYGPSIDLIREALRTNLLLLRRYQQLRQTMQQELPEVAQVMLPLFQLSPIFTEGSQEEQNAHNEQIRAVYRQHKDALDAFWQRHPDLSGESLETVSKEQEPLPASD
jgi:hypothetical protein